MWARIYTAMAIAGALARCANASLVLDLNGNGLCDVTTPHHAFATGPFVERGSVTFDIVGDGVPRRCEWLKPDADGLLVLDKNGNGVIDGPTELFGNTDGYESGYAKLSLLDRNGDGVLTGSELAQLWVWEDNGDGGTQPGELKSVKTLGITKIDVRHSRYVSTFVRNGTQYSSWDWFPRTLSHER